MIKQGIRLYSLQEIHAMIQEGTYTDDFRYYLDTAPEVIRSYISTLTGKAEKKYHIENRKDDVDVNEFQKVDIETGTDGLYVESLKTEDIILKRIIPDSQIDENVQPQVEEKRNEQGGSTGVESAGCEDTLIQKNQTIQGNAEAETDIKDFLTDENPYALIKFGKRIIVQNLLLHEQTQKECRMHMAPYTEIQVVVQLRKGRYSLITNCCKKCKYLYMEKRKFDGIAPVLKKKHISYVWIPSRRGNDSEKVN